MSTAELDPELAANMKTELTAVQEGHGPLHEELRDGLGKFSLAASKIEDAQKQIETDKGNMEFLDKFGQILPRSSSGRFELDGRDAQYLIRQIQANTLWINLDADIEWSYYPYYVIGRQESPDNPEAVKVLLLSIESPYLARRGETKHKVKLVSVNKEDMEARDSLVASLQDDELTDEQIARMMDKNTGKLLLKYETPGNIRLFNGGWHRGDTPEERVLKSGIRLEGNSWTVVKNFQDRVPGSVMEQLHVDTTLAKLATAFKIEDKYRALLDGKTSEPEEQKDYEAVAERLREQNDEMRETIKSMMLAANILDGKEIDEQLDKRFPRQ